jgi:acyl-CoA dehydrogenase
MRPPTASPEPIGARGLRAILAAPEPSLTTLEAWLEARDAWPAPPAAAWDLAIEAAVASDRLAFAFASGFEAALRRLTGEAAIGLGATEEGGPHPRAIQTRARPDGSGYRLDGVKRFVTLGPVARAFWVIARRGEQADGRPELVAVRLAADHPGLRVEPLPPAPMVPELPHARLVLEQVHVDADAFVAGDGYTGVLRPFRTVEDVFVHGAVAARLAADGLRHGWPEPLVEALLAVVAGLTPLSEADPSAPETHLALAGVLAGLEAQLDAIDDAMGRSPAALAERWARDRSLMRVAEGARRARRARAWERRRGG